MQALAEVVRVDKLSRALRCHAQGGAARRPHAGALDSRYRRGIWYFL